MPVLYQPTAPELLHAVAGVRIGLLGGELVDRAHTAMSGAAPAPQPSLPPEPPRLANVSTLPNDQGQTTGYMVMKIKGPVVHLDGNHPLAGERLWFRCAVKAVRPASAEELAHGHVHGAHHHHQVHLATCVFPVV